MAENGQYEESDFPSELKDRLSNFDESITDVEEILKPLHDVPIHELQAEMLPLERAKLDLIGAYAMNSLFWVYLNAKGENPKQHGIKQELDRIRTYMGRVKEIEDRAKAPKLNKGAAKRFVRNALWQQAHQQPAQNNDSGSETTGQSMGDTSTGEEASASSANETLTASAVHGEEIPSKRLKTEGNQGTNVQVKSKKKKKRK